MIYNYLKLAIRLLVRNPFFTMINVCGLAIGFASFFGLWNYAIIELRTDEYHKDYNQIALFGVNWNWTDDGTTWGHTDINVSPSPTVPRLQDDFPEVESYLRLRTVTIAISTVSNRKEVFKERKAIYADRNLFTFFTIPLKYGNPEEVLSQPNAIVLSETSARKLFGSKNPLNESLLVDGRQTVRVTGVFEDLPNNTHLDFSLVLSNHALLNSWNTDPNIWSANYIKLNSSDLVSFERKLDPKMTDYWAELHRKFPMVKADANISPVSSVAFGNLRNWENDGSKSRLTLQMMVGVGLVILIMAFVNYINLTLARTTRRLKEVATRKVAGARFGDLSAQFMIEALVTNTIAVAMALTLLQLVRNPLRSFLNIHITDWQKLDGMMILLVAVIIIAGILVTGLYPAWIVKSAPPVSLLGAQAPSTRNYISSVLTTIQYSAAILLIFTVLVIQNQLSLIFNKNFGFDRTNMFIVYPPIHESDYQVSSAALLAQKFKTHSIVKSVSLTSNYINLRLTKSLRDEFFIMTDGYLTLYDPVQVLNMTIIAGRSFRPEDEPDKVILTRLAAERIGLRTPEDAVGQTIFAGNGMAPMEIIGVAQDIKSWFFFVSDDTETQTGRGMAWLNRPELDGQTANLIYIKLENSSPENLSEIEKIFKSVYPNAPFDGTYLEDIMMAPYAGEKILRRQLVFFTLLAVGIACVGLLGMITNKVIRKTREIGIRKALGAGTINIAHVLLSSTVGQVLIAIVIGSVGANFLSDYYLSRYVERISIELYHFVVPATILVTLMSATIFVLIAKVIQSNPVNALRHEG